MAEAGTSPGLLAGLSQAPDVYVQKFDLARSAAYLLRLGRSDFQAASFLDDRVLARASAAEWVELKGVIDRATHVGPGRPMHFIFHTGHVGSTLLSRLLETVPGVLSLREPFILRQLADCHDEAATPESFLSPQTLDLLTRSLLRLLGRGFDDTSTVVLKATSSVGRIGAVLLAKLPGARAICLNVGVETHLASMLENPASLVDLRGMARERIRRLRGYGLSLQTPLFALSSGQLAAVSWLAESWSQQRMQSAFPQRVLRIDFDLLLRNVREEAGKILKHLGLQHDEDMCDLLANSPALSRYAKSPDRNYSADTRVQNLAASRARNGEEIGKGLALIHQIAARSPGIAVLLAPGAQDNC